MNEITQEQSEAVLEVIDTSMTLSQITPTDTKPPSGNGNKSNRQGMSVLDEKTWERLNARRGDLIRQKYTASLTSAEQTELAALEATATKYLNAVAPLFDYPLDVLQAYAERNT